MDRILIEPPKEDKEYIAILRDRPAAVFLTHFEWGSDDHDSVLCITLFAAGSKPQNEPDSQ